MAYLATFVLCSLTPALATPALGATVKELKKRVAEVTLDDGESFEKGAEVCAVTDSGDKILCGTVTKIRGSAMFVKFDNSKKLKKIKAGIAIKKADEEGSGDGSASGSSGGDDADSASGKKAKKEAVKHKVAKNPFRIIGVFGPALSTPAKFSKLVYNPPTTDSPASLWTKDKTIKSASFGFDFSVAIPLGNMALVPGARYRAFTPSLVDADYNLNRQNPYVSTEQKATAYGAWVDFDFLRITPAPIFALNMLAGLDVDMSTVAVKATKKDDSAGAAPETTLADATSKLNILSLRLGTDMDLLFLKVAGAHLGLTVSIPFVQFGASASVKVGDGESRGVADAAKDLQTALGHSKNSFGLEAEIGGVLAF